MNTLLIIGLTLMVIYIVGQFSFVFYARSAYKKLKEEIIAQGRLITFMPVITVATIGAGPGPSMAQQHMEAPPNYMQSGPDKVHPPPYTP